MTTTDLHHLKPGDVIRSSRGEAWIVTQNYPRVKAIRMVNVDNPPEWTIVSKGDWRGLSEVEREL